MIWSGWWVRGFRLAFASFQSSVSLSGLRGDELLPGMERGGVVMGLWDCSGSFAGVDPEREDMRAGIHKKGGFRA